MMQDFITKLKQKFSQTLSPSYEIHFKTSVLAKLKFKKIKFSAYSRLVSCLFIVCTSPALFYQEGYYNLRVLCCSLQVSTVLNCWFFKDVLKVKTVHESCLNRQGISVSSIFYSLETI